eukprot:2011877-Rhodomonas_salina.1
MQVLPAALLEPHSVREKGYAVGSVPRRARVHTVCADGGHRAAHRRAAHHSLVHLGHALPAHEWSAPDMAGGRPMSVPDTA